MPVPSPTDDDAAPRRLLRDIVYDQIFEAIADGTLEFGERLNDDDLVKWLGVSRTPVREAIAKLGEHGIVDIEANRYTRVIAPTVEEFADTTTIGNEVWALIARYGVPRMTDGQRAHFAQVTAVRRAAIVEKSPTALAPLFDMVRILLAVADSPMLVRLDAATGARLTLMFRRIAVTEFYPWDLALTITDLLGDAVAKGDSDAAFEAFLWRDHGLPDALDAIRGSGIFPEKAAGVFPEKATGR